MSKTQLDHQFGHQFDHDLLTKIFANSLERHYKKDDIIIDIDQELNYIPLLLEGNIKVLREDNDGHELLLYILESGDTCAMSLTCCMSESKSKIRAVADSDSKLMMIPIKFMFEWFNENKSWRNFILRSYQSRFNELLDTIDTLAFLKMDKRLIKYLSDQVKLKSSTTISTTHQQIAEDLHTSRVVISRLLKQFEEADKIKIGRNKIEVLDIK